MSSGWQRAGKASVSLRLVNDEGAEYDRQRAAHRAQREHFQSLIQQAIENGQYMTGCQLSREADALPAPSRKRINNQFAEIRAAEAKLQQKAKAEEEAQQQAARAGERSLDAIREELRLSDERWRLSRGLALPTRPTSARSPAATSLRVALPRVPAPSAGPRWEVIEDQCMGEAAHRRAKQLAVGQRHLRQIFGGSRRTAAAAAATKTTGATIANGDTGRWPLASPPTKTGPPVATSWGGVRSMQVGEYGTVLASQRASHLDRSQEFVHHAVLPQLSKEDWETVGYERAWRYMRPVS